MGAQISNRTVWELVRRQHGVIALWQLLELGFGRKAIKHRVARGRLHHVAWGVYAVGRPDLTQHGRWMVAVLAAGDGAVLSHHSAATLWGICPLRKGKVHVTVPVDRRPQGITPHLRHLTDEEVTRRDGIPVASVVLTLIDLATQLSDDGLDRAVNEADRLDLVDPERLREALDHQPRRPGVRRLRTLLDDRTFTLTDSVLERRFLKLAQEAGLPRPLTQQWVNGFRVDFHWPELDLVVETDGLRYHRTPEQQARALLRDQAHTAAGTTPLRFSHAQVAKHRAYVGDTLGAVARRAGRTSVP